MVPVLWLGALHGLAREALRGHWGLAEEGEEQGVWRDAAEAPRPEGGSAGTVTSTHTVSVTVENGAAKPEGW